MICALCQEEKGKLIDSHFMPAAAYTHIRGRQSLGNNSPIRINRFKNKSYRTDQQVKRPLLCQSCENLFSTAGERCMGRLWATAKGFPLLELLDTDALMSSGEYFNTYDARKLDSAIVESLFYFAVSIFWRANVWDWGWEQDGYRRALGPYEKDFRDFLLTGKKLESALLVLSVNSDKETAAVMSFPTCSRSGEDKLHTFVLLGIRFMMYVGGKISSETRLPFELMETQIIIVSSDFSKSPAFGEFAKVIQSQTLSKKFLDSLLPH